MISLLPWKNASKKDSSHSLLDDEERSLLSLPPRLGRLGIKNPVEAVLTELDNSKKVRATFQKWVNAMTDQTTRK